MIIQIVAVVAGILFIVTGISTIISSKKAAGIACLIFGIAVAMFGLSITIIPTGYTGVRTAYGQISDKPVKRGINFHVPFVEAIHRVNCKQQEKDFGDLKVWAETSERTELYFEHVVVDYQINPEYAAWIWQNVEEWDTNLLKQTNIESGLKAAAKQYNDIDVTDRSKIEGTMKERIQKSLNEKYGNQVLNIVSVNVGNINFSDAYNKAIEEKAKAKIAAEEAEYKGKEKKIKAEAEAEEKRIKAQGEADATKIKAEAEAEANKKISESLTPELLERKKIEKWDGKLPTVTGGSTPMLDISTGENQE